MRRLLPLQHYARKHWSTMALNAASHNPAGVKTGPISGQPPPVSSDTITAISESSKQDALGQHEGGQDGGDKKAETKAKSAKDVEKERKKMEKMKKFEEKNAKKASSSTSAEVSKTKDKKSKQDSLKEDALPPYKESTPLGAKKSTQ